MSIQIVQENIPYSIETLADILNVGQSKLRLTIDSLLKCSVLRVATRIEEYDLDDLVDCSSLINNHNPNDLYSFRYVGVLVINETIVFVYPKYIRHPESDRYHGFVKFKQVLSVIAKYNHSNQSLLSSFVVNDAISNPLSLAIGLLNNFYENGLYANEKTVLNVSGDGEIHWDSTIGYFDPVISDESIVYLDFVKSNLTSEINDYFRKLHACILTQCSKEFKELFSILNLPMANLSNHRLSDFGDLQTIKYRLDSELGQQFVTYRQEILSLMIGYIESKSSINNFQNQPLYGTNSFNLVWEDVCKFVYDDALDRKLADVGLHYDVLNPKVYTLRDCIDKTVWKSKNIGQQVQARNTLIPDIVSVEPGTLSIYDAKYYNFKFSENYIKSAPGIGSITKQYLYEVAYKRLSEENRLRITRNAFLFPSDESCDELIGSVEFPIFSYLDSGLHEIELIYKSCALAFDEYLNG